ncbi:hypothetical protein GcLGCM259_1756 [Glutamicibacter creatinolyticus]|uniref:Uncharacterized protein n=1 Tax=Glutamicibacter creatinolyticus TaxID=162496 RepID=A0A5B7WVY6_9MICC|nr:DUF6421 family protein [Glutamicibacter creatinolyticus]QCY47475.1 hypothetical protein GcLGCM259_1756 [Glutamicibacter creatinolyticus]
MTQSPVHPQVNADELVNSDAWQNLKAAATEFQSLQVKDGSLADAKDLGRARELLQTVIASVQSLAPSFPHDASYLQKLVADLRRWSEEGVGVPDFLDSLLQFQPQGQRQDGLLHLVVFPMYTQNGSTNRHLEAVLVQVMWPDFIAELEASNYSNALFVPLRFLDFTPGYDTNSAVLFPESVAIRETPSFTWGAIFQDREAVRFRKVLKEAAAVTNLELPADAAELLEDQQLAEDTFIMWDLIHDRTHMRGDLPFDPFMIKQRMPYFLYSLEELRCDLTAFRECVKIANDAKADERTTKTAKLVQYAVIFDRIFRFAITGSRVRNYDGLGGQLLFAWMHQNHVLHWTDTKLSIDWDEVPAVVSALGDAIDELYWKSIDRPKLAHWLAAYELVSTTVTPHPASTWAKGPDALPLTAPLREITDQVMDDEFPLSMFYEALSKKMKQTIESTRGMYGASLI